MNEKLFKYLFLLHLIYYRQKIIQLLNKKNCVARKGLRNKFQTRAYAVNLFYGTSYDLYWYDECITVSVIDWKFNRHALSFLIKFQNIFTTFSAETTLFVSAELKDSKMQNESMFRKSR